MIQVASPLQSYIKRKNLIDKNITKTLNSGNYILGKSVALFEKNFKNYQNQKYCLGVANGTDALEISLKSIGIQHNDHVLVPSHTATATISAIVNSGAIPLFCDIDEKTNNVSVETLKDLINQKLPKAIVFVHLYGNSAGINDVAKIAKKNKIFLIEDCSQAHGAEVDKIKVGCFGDVACFSCYPTKNLGAIGDAGIITTNHSSIYKKALKFREYGWTANRISNQDGRNSRLDEIQASILNVKLKFLDSDNNKRILIAKYYNEKLKNLPINVPVTNSKENVFHLYVIKVNQNIRNKLINYLKENNINAGIHYKVPNHQHPAFKKYKRYCNMKVTEKTARTIISLPNYPEITKKEIDYIIKILTNFYKK